MLDFASATWDGWDYIPEAWDPWLTASDGVILIAVTMAADEDAGGRPLVAGRPIAMARVTLLAAGEAWLEGIRVDPAVRGREVGTNLQVAELAWAEAHGATVIRYTTGEANEASHRLGARHGFVREADRRSYGQTEGDAPEGPTDPSAVRVLEPDAGPDLIARWWATVEGDATFAAGDRLYECRRWAFQALTADRFAAHVRRGEVLLARDEAALALVPRPPVWPHDGHTHGGADVALIAGDGAAALTLLDDLRRAVGTPPRVRLPDPAPLLAGDVAEVWTAAGFAPHRGVLHVLMRPLGDRASLPAAEPPEALTFLEPPHRIAQPPRL